jgi:hypothetical protein
MIRRGGQTSINSATPDIITACGPRRTVMPINGCRVMARTFSESVGASSHIRPADHAKACTVACAPIVLSTATDASDAR